MHHAIMKHSDIVVHCLKDLAGFFRNMAEDNSPLENAMASSAQLCEQVAHLMETDPLATLSEERFASWNEEYGPFDENVQNFHLAAILLRRAVSFLRTIGEVDETLTEQMRRNAELYEQMADLLENDPEGEMEV